ncbi:hypothetical protein H2198_000206 [Neophaeococcomyces mojaviensis]|uniref:Uncharacterized protein n=1 Tax=Neophaeococcomyces mojaviensis TaxID=3383035 RepID=A0ACC3ALB7_9EURO|nr:hypothetical protein H2198_000206 [Knufia sp. JES_112]
MDITARQLKMRIKSWGYDDKKISGQSYRAMEYVMEQLGRDIDFQASIRNGRAWISRSAAYIHKEVKRQKERKPSEREYQNLAEAIEYLQRQGVRLADSHFPPINAPNATNIATWPSMERLTGEATDTTNSDDSESTTSTDTLPDNLGTAPMSMGVSDHSYQQRRPTYNLTNPNLDTSLRPRMWHQLPNPDAFAINLHESVLPQTAANQIMSGSSEPHIATEPRIVRTSDALDDLTLHLADMTLTFESDDPRRVPWEKFLGIKLEQHYRHAGRDGNRLIVEFVAYYIQQTLAGFDTLDDYDHADRVEARAKLKQMLDAENDQVLIAINWISAVIGSNDKGAQLSAFYEDCWTCVESSDSIASRILGPSIRFALLMHGVDQRTPQNLSASPTTRQRRLEVLAGTFNGDKEFQDSISLVVQHGHRDSSTHLILRYQYAWFLLQTGQTARSLEILLDSLSLAERLMGCNHLVTVSCYVIAARAYEKDGAVRLAMTYLEYAKFKFENCPNPLQAYYHRLLERLASLQFDIGDYEPSLFNLERVLEFRVRTLGPRSGSTWETAHKLFPTLIKLGRGDEARKREEELRALHDDEWRAARV